LKKAPPLESLFSDSCRKNNEQIRADKHYKQLLEKEKKEQSRKDKENKTVAILVEKYFSKLPFSELQQMQNQF
jgi:hypothetical protein